MLSVGGLLGSQGLLGVVGLACLPVLARNLGPASYGRFSLFLTLLGVLTQMDFARPLLVRARAAEPRRGEDGLASLTGAATLVLAPLGLTLGLFALTPLAGLLLAAALALGTASAVPYARLAARGRVGTAGSVRNGAWAAALVATLLCSFVTPGVHAFAWSFAGANLVVLLSLRRLAGERGPWLHAPDLAVLRRNARPCADLFLFSLASAVVVSADKLALESFASGEVFGRYLGQVDLAVKLHLVSTALGHVLYPHLARLRAEAGHEQAARAFVRFASWTVAGAFVLCLGLVLGGRALVSLVLGEAFLGGSFVYPVLVCGVFVHLLGFLITPWQRARGDFATHRRAYVAAALVMCALALVLVPPLGAWGAVLAYLGGRTAELSLAFGEARRLGPELLPRARLVAWGAMVLVLAAAAASSVAGGTP